MGAGQFYLMTIKDKNGSAFDGAATYRLAVPPNVPITLYWSATAYDRATHTLIRDTACASRSSNTRETLKTLARMFAIFWDLGEREAQHSGVGQCLASGVLLTLFGSVALRVKAVPVVPALVASVAGRDASRGSTPPR
jgi:hypothetical protein